MENRMENDVETVGEMLKNTRLKSGKTLNDVANDLCIRKVYLKAIEEMDFDNIPEMPYGLGFIRTYARYLGLNSDRIVASYRQLDADGNGNKLADEDEHPIASAPRFKHIALGVLGLVLLVGGWFAFPSYKKYENIDDQQETVAESSLIEETETADTQNAIEPDSMALEQDQVSISETEIENNDTTEKAEDVSENAEDADNPDVTAEAVQNLRFVLTGPSWVELRQGGKVIFQGIQQKGFSYEIPNVADTYITVGRHYYAQFYRGDELVKIVSAMKKKNVKLDEYLNLQE